MALKRQGLAGHPLPIGDVLLTGVGIGIALATVPLVLLFLLLANRYEVDAGNSPLGRAVGPVLLVAAITLFVGGIIFAIVRNLFAHYSASRLELRRRQGP